MKACEVVTVIEPDEYDIFTFCDIGVPDNATQYEKEMHQMLDSFELDKVNLKNYLYDRQKTRFNSPARIKREQNKER